MAGCVTAIGEVRNEYRIVIVNPLRKHPLGRPERITEDYIKFALSRICYEVARWM
jgi:hypothetical protein